jgi:hypothetical protein
MHIPIFLSCPSDLNPAQARARRRILGELDRAGFEWRSLGKSDYPTVSPLREVLVIAKHCSGGVVLGFSQFEAPRGVWKKGSKAENTQGSRVVFPTPWNQLEAGVLFSLGLPVLVFSEAGVKGGVFDHGVTDAFVHRVPIGPMTSAESSSLREVILKWSAEVRQRYYAEHS